MTRSIAILGAGGFIGNHLALRLAASGHSVIAASRKPSSFEHPNIRNLVGVYDAPEHFRDLVQSCDTIIHAAASSTPGSTANAPLREIVGDLQSTLSMLSSMQSATAPRLLYFSSGGGIYGDRRTGGHTERSAVHPRSYHGAAKASAEHFVHAWAKQYDKRAVILRPSNVYGPGQVGKPGFGIVPWALAAASRGEPFTIWGDGGATRDYLYVDDLTDLVTRILDTEFAPGVQTVNAAAGVATSINDLLATIEAVTGRTISRTYQSPRRVDLQSVALDNRMARAQYQWLPRTDLRSGLEETWRWTLTKHSEDPTP